MIDMPIQLRLFEDNPMVVAELRVVLADFDVVSAEALASRFQRDDPDLTWEFPVLTWIRASLEYMNDLDRAWQLWEDFAGSPMARSIPVFYFEKLRSGFFRRLLETAPNSADLLRSPEGRSIGDFQWLAERPLEALRHYEEEIRRIGDSWELRVKVGNCHSRMGDPTPARSSYRFAWLSGLSKQGMGTIYDQELVGFLRAAEDPDWAFAEACVAGVLPVCRFSTLEDFGRFRAGYAHLIEGESDGGAEDRARRFGLFWVISENRQWLSESEWIAARRAMRQLHPRLTAIYLEHLEAVADRFPPRFAPSQRS